MYAGPMQLILQHLLGLLELLQERYKHTTNNLIATQFKKKQEKPAMAARILFRNNEDTT